MKKNEASSTAALLALIVALRWHTDDENAKLQAELLRNVSWGHMSLPFWIFMRVLLCHHLISKFALYLVDWEKTGGKVYLIYWCSTSCVNQPIKVLTLDHEFVPDSMVEERVHGETSTEIYR